MLALLPTARHPVNEDPRGGPHLLFGCSICYFADRCGGLGQSENGWDCFVPCGSDCKNGCPFVCPRSPDDFANRIAELAPHGLEVETVTAESAVSVPILDQHIPRVDHGSNRSLRLDARIVAIPLRLLINFKSGKLIHKSAGALRSHFKISRAARILAVGVAKDHELEALWGIRHAIRDIARSLRHLGVLGVTAPNFSSFANVPRTEDLSNYVRQAMIWRDFVNAGMPAAYHYNGQTASDLKYIARFIQNNPMLYWISAEFDTGAKNPEVFEQLLSDLQALPSLVQRPLGIILVGGVRALDALKRRYERTCFVDGHPFFKAFNRRLLSLADNGKLMEQGAPRSADLGRLLIRNVLVRRALISQQITRGRAG